MCVLMWRIDMKCLSVQGAHLAQCLEYSYLRWRTRQHTHLIHNLYVLYCPATQFEIPQPCALVYFDTIPHNS
ncbi:MAG: hypothetical protein EZS28_002868 [Streblomastix strix]|uniref:Uncharacterized protein n=1 Tax=Streblomastix strix TaxID=222440 RepID=A0A5J4X4E3_9EUKA|nr:MAG: hypothetical protein EZS28_002868 [Streblomastix strix]